VVAHTEIHAHGQANRTEREIKFITTSYYQLLELSSKTICATVSPCKAVAVKGKLVPVNGIKVYGRVEIQVPSFLTSGLDTVKWSVSCLGHFTPVDSRPTH
jgi:hypothetical protein